MSVQPGTAIAAESLAVPDGGEVITSVRPLQLTIQTFVENRLATVGLGVIVALVLFSFVGPLLYHTNQTTISPLAVNQAPSNAHPLGTDNLGYDVLGRLMVGGQSSIEIGLAVALASTVLGVVYGAASGVIGGLVDAAMMRVLDALFSIPTLFVLLILSDIFRPSLPLLIVVLAVISWMGPARLVRGETLSFTVRDFVMASRLAGSGRAWVIRHHIVPNVIGVVVVNASFQVVTAILAMASLTYLGLGLPNTASWGGMLSNGINNIYDGYWWEIYPAGLALVLIVVAFSLVGDALRDTFETRLITR